MPSTARTHQLKQSLIYHIFNRGHNRDRIFRDQDDYRYFIKRLAEYSSASDMRVYHWALMPNHYHIVAEIDPPEKLSSLMAGLGRSYVHYHHKKYKTAGFVWQGRFKSQPIQKELYLLVCGRYVERNPVTAQMVSNAWEYEFSSARFYVTGEPDAITYQSPLFSTFAGTADAQRQNYKEFLQSFNREEDSFFENMEFPRGSREFVKRLVKDSGRFVPRRQGRVAVAA